jgi:glucokinase
MSEVPYSMAGVGVAGARALSRSSAALSSESNNLPMQFEGFPVRDDISARLGTVPVILENDANAAAMGEKWLGAGRDVDSTSCC